MGSHRAEPGSTSTPSTYVGRRAARPATGPSDQPSPGLERTAAPTPYVGRRIARPVETVATEPPTITTPALVLDEPPTITTPALVLDEPPTVTVPVVAPRAGQSGRRRAARSARTARGPLFGALPSTPVLLGVATLALAVGGALASNGPVLADHHGPSIRAASAQHGSGSIAADRGQTTSRSFDRQGLQLTAGSDTTASTAQVAHHDAAMDKLTQAAQHQAARLNNSHWDLPIDPGVYHLTARFGDYGLWANFHTGLDFACPIGTPIHAVASGVVTFASYDGAYGNKTVVTLPDGTEIWYGHQTTQYVKVGDTVTRGEVIGTVGATGHVTGPHVHIEVRPHGGDPIDPFPQFVAHGVTP